MLFVFAELMGVPNPATHYTLETTADSARTFSCVAPAHGYGAFTTRPFPLLLVWGRPIIEPMTATLRDLFTHHLIFVGGKGGVGKTTTASALGLAAADEGRTCLLVSTDPAHSLGDIFDTAIGDTRTPLVDRVWGLEIDPDAEGRPNISRR